MPEKQQSESEKIPELTPEMRKKIAREEELKRLSTPLKFRRFAWSTVGVAMVSAIGVAIALWNEGTLKELWWAVLLVPFGAAVYMALILGLGVFIRSIVRSRLERELATSITIKKSEELQEQLDANFFTNLVKINFKYIDKYYLQTQLQADKSFLLCAIAASVSLSVILAGIILLFVRQSAKEAGYVATAAGTLGEFIAAVFFYLYNRTIIKMGEYHQKLVLTQNIGLALKITEELPAPEQVAARAKLVDYLSKDINLFLTARPIESPTPPKAKTPRNPKT
jgi:hypothetical protein